MFVIHKTLKGYNTNRNMTMTLTLKGIYSDTKLKKQKNRNKLLKLFYQMSHAITLTSIKY